MSVNTRSSLSFKGLFALGVFALVVPAGGVATASDAPICADLGVFACGDANRDGSVTSTDALLALQGGIGGLYCDPCLCDTSGSSGVTATDALMVLQDAVGGGVLFSCEACDASVCGDSTRTPFRGAPLGTTVNFPDWCLLLDANPNDLERDITATLTKVLDTFLAPVPDATVRIVSHGCDCGFLRTGARVAAAATTTTTGGSVTTSTLGFCNCMVSLRAESPVPLALVETYVDLYDGDCGNFVGSGTMLVDGGVEEECDDGNQVSGDGCSAECRLE